MTVVSPTQRIMRTNTMAAKVAEGQTTIKSMKKVRQSTIKSLTKDLNATIKAADATALMTKKNANARIKAADYHALMATHNADARIHEADANALGAKQAVATAIRAERTVTAHNLQKITKN